MNKQWIINKKQSDDIIEQLLLSRGVQKNNWASFLNPSFEKGLHDPYLLNGMELAVKRIAKSILNKEKIGIFADYDADGVPAGAMLHEVLEFHGLESHVYIPSRSEGYGLNKKGIDELKDYGCSLLITVDLGIRDNEKIEYAKSLGLDVIVTDHHEPGVDLPKSLVTINPKLKNSKYPFRELSGGGVVFKLAQAMQVEFKKLTEADLKWMLDLVGITTICDVVPLVDENRIFAKYGLVVLSKTRRIGLRKLYEISKIEQKNIKTYTVGYQIGPRLNAPGRLNQKQESLDLLLVKDEFNAKRLAIELDQINRERQYNLEIILKDARAQLIHKKLNKKKVICLWSKGWTSGLIGLVAGKLLEEYSRPVIILDQGREFMKGSARSVENCNMVELLESTKDLLVGFGGHAKAAGLTIKNENINLFYERILSLVDKMLDEKDLIPKINIDMVVDYSVINLLLYDKISMLEPFGLGNSRPIFVLKKIRAQNIKTIGNDSNHLKFTFQNIDIIGFGLAGFKDVVQENDIDIAFNLDENIWNGNRKVQIKIIDIKISEV